MFGVSLHGAVSRKASPYGDTTEVCARCRSGIKLNSEFFKDQPFIKNSPDNTCRSANAAAPQRTGKRCRSRWHFLERGPQAPWYTGAAAPVYRSTRLSGALVDRRFSAGAPGRRTVPGAPRRYTLFTLLSMFDTSFTNVLADNLEDMNHAALLRI